MNVSKPLDLQRPGSNFCNMLYDVMRRGGISDDNKAKVANIMMNIIMTPTRNELTMDDLLREVQFILSS
jgi:hypothetical protein